MKKRNRMISAALTMMAAFSLTACTDTAAQNVNENPGSVQDGGDATEAASENTGADAESAEGTVYKVGICNYVDDASLNQIYENIEAQLDVLGSEQGVTYEIVYDNCNADANVMNQIIENFISGEKVDLMVGIATPVAMTMQSATEDTQIPVIFSAVSDPLSAGLVDSLDAPGHNITGTSDYLNTDAIMDLMFEADPDIQTVGLLYDMGQDASTSAINDAKAYLDAKGIKYIERTGTTVDEVMLAADTLAKSDKVDAVFTPSDNTIMQAELAIYETLAEAGIPHYAGADSFALNGAFLGYGVDYANLGVVTAEMVSDILVNGKDVSAEPVRTFDNGTATVNTEICEQLGYDFDTISAAFEPYCTRIETIVTAEDFE